MKKGDVSVIIPCYNSGDTLNRAVESIIKQTMLPMEIICVNDCSNDGGNTRKEMLRLKDKYSKYLNFHIINLPKNMGAAYARNCGWRNAKRKYVAFLDSDDAWNENKINVQYEIMERNPEIYLTCTRVKACGNENMLKGEMGELRTKIIDKYKILIKNEVFTPSVMMRNDKAFMFEEAQRYSEDIWLWNHIAFDRKIILIDCPLTILFKNHYGDSGLSSNMWGMEKGELRSFFDLYRKGYIGRLIFLGVVSFSMMKYLRRIIIVLLHR